ncbi:hypothetical protein ACH5RR_000391 [Cinchona calisaya]|uniref:PHD-type zinc finger plants domain-containing protein n=1 Tax=Cinchona calisaya TaxID=153742 RepID=A0ABD3B0H7_9GENT
MGTPTQKANHNSPHSLSSCFFFLSSSWVVFLSSLSSCIIKKILPSRRIIMVDYHIVCSMCGDVGFPDKLFRCNKCHNRFQHSYCSSYYSESSEPIEVCDWCKSEERISSARHGGSSSRGKSSSVGNDANRSEYSGERIKQQHDREEGSERGGKNPPPSGTPSPRTTTRRYKLLKDVMC